MTQHHLTMLLLFLHKYAKIKNMKHHESAFQPQGDPIATHENRWFSTRQQPMDFMKNGKVAYSAEQGGQMNYVDMKPGVSIVADIGGHSTILVPQERYPTNLIEGKPTAHYEVPAGGTSDKNFDGSEESIIRAAEAEFGEESGYTADDFIVLGTKHRGLITQPNVSTHHNYTVLARGVSARNTGQSLEVTEAIGTPTEFTWHQAEDMYLNPEGLWTPDQGFKIISSAATVASLSLAQAWLRRQEARKSAHIDLGRRVNLRQSK